MIYYRLILLFLTFYCQKNYSQASNCEQMHVGKFELKSKVSGTTTIIRTATTQTEINKLMDVKSIYDIVWIDKCTYELRNRRLLKGDTKYNGEPNDVFKIHILKVEGIKAWLKTTANFTDFVTESVVYKIE